MDYLELNPPIILYCWDWRVICIYSRRSCLAFSMSLEKGPREVRHFKVSTELPAFSSSFLSLSLIQMHGPPRGAFWKCTQGFLSESLEEDISIDPKESWALKVEFHSKLSPHYYPERSNGHSYPWIVRYLPLSPISSLYNTRVKGFLISLAVLNSTCRRFGTPLANGRRQAPSLFSANHAGKEN